MTDQTQVVRDIYTAFGEGRIPDILAQLADDITFVQPGGPDIPWAGAYKGPADVGRFFAKLDDAVAVDAFEPREYVTQGDTVIALGAWAGKAKATGKPFASTWSMTWKFRGGKVSFYEAFEDTAVMAPAFRA